MSKVIIDEKQVDEVLNRGVEIVYPTKDDLKKKLMSGQRIRLYCGFDPSAPSLHIGNAIQINKLSQFQALGHEVIFLIGDFTGMIGDPTDKSSARKTLTREEVLANSKAYKKQASVYLDFEGENPAVIRYNSEWSDKLTFKDLIEISANFTVQQMIQRDMFQDRIKEEKPIYLHEFLYPLAQGYDSVGMDVDLEIGGNDQMFNMMAGRDLMKSLGKRDKNVLTTRLLADEAGKKMGKSEGNAVFLDQKAEDVYGAVMSWTDGVIVPGFELATKVSMEKVDEVKKRLADGENPRNLKMELAREFVGAVHGKAVAEEAEAFFVKTVQNKEIPDEIESKKLKVEKISIIDALVETGLVKSKGEGRRLIEQNGIKINGEVVTDESQILVLTEEILLQRGKRQFVKISR